MSEKITETQKEIATLEDKINSADSSNEPDTSAVLRELLADEAILIGPQGQLFAKAFILEAHRPPQKQTFDKVIISELSIQDLGLTAVAHCRAEFHQKTKTFSLRYNRVWHKKQGQWKVVSGTVTFLTA